MNDHSGIHWLRIPRLLSVVATIALAGCVQHSTEPVSLQEPARAGYTPVRSEPLLCRPKPALLVPPPAPDCAFRRQALKTMDPDEFSRLKVEYELKCYQNAERSVRQRLRQLQEASRCQIASAR
jgi:hypothetical protein